MKTFKFAKTEEIEEPVSEWLCKVRTLDKELIPPPGLYLYYMREIITVIHLLNQNMQKCFGPTDIFCDFCPCRNEVNWTLWVELSSCSDQAQQNLPFAEIVPLILV